MLDLEECYNNRMLRKNSPRRFHTAAARIVMTGKLPSDFFLPSSDGPRKEQSKWVHPHRSENIELDTTSTK